MPISTAPSPMKDSARSTPSSSDMSKMKTFATATAISTAEAMRSTCDFSQTPATSSATPMRQPQRRIGIGLELAHAGPQADVLALEQPPHRQRRIDEGEHRRQQRRASPNTISAACRAHRAPAPPAAIAGSR